MSEGMDRLRHLFVFHLESSTCLYYHQFKQGTVLDMKTIYDFLVAISPVPKKKPVQKKGSSEVKELVYKEYRLLIKSGGPCMFVVAIIDQATDAIKAKLTQFTEQFLRTYDKVLKNYKGNVRLFKDADKDVQSTFGFTNV